MDMLYLALVDTMASETVLKLLGSRCLTRNVKLLAS